MSKRFSKVGALTTPYLSSSGKLSQDFKRNQTVLHLSTLGAIRGEQNNTFVDDSPNRYTITRTGNVAPSTFTPFGDSWSNYFDGSGDYLSLANNAGWNFGSGNFTIECWIYSIGTGNPERILAAWNAPANANAPFSLTIGGGAGVQFGISSTGSDYITVNGSVSRLTWAHVAVVRNGTTLSMYINGVLSESITTSVSILTPNAPLIIGGRNNNGTYIEFFNGNISNLRIVKGTALYTANFTPSKSPLTAVSGTSLLTCASNRFQDKSSNNFTITPVGNVAVKTASPFPQAKEFKKPQRGWCVPFNGSTQRLETPAASVANGLQLGTSDFTIECWVKAKTQATFSRVIDTGAYSNPNYGFILSSRGTTTDTSLEFAMYTGNTVNYVSILLPDVLVNAWKHLAIVRSGDTIYGYVDGVLVNSAAIGVNTRNLNYVTPITIGVYKSPTTGTYSNYFSGKISNVMIVKKALYSSNFVPMQSPRTAQQNDVNPVLLTCQGGSVIDYSYSSHTLTSAGSLVVDSDGPFGQDDELSYYFDGNGDYLSIADNAALELGSDDFTMECWFNSAVAAKAQANSDASYHISLARKGNSIDFAILGTASALTGFAFNGFVGATGYLLNGNFSFSSNTWYHVAAARQSGVLRLFVNGTQIALNNSYTYSINDNANALTIGSAGSGTEYALNGNISNFRIVKGTALYTSSFTPSRKPLPAVSGTSLLTCRGRTAIDDSTNALTVTVFGNAAVHSRPSSGKSPFHDDERFGMSYYFDGSGDTLNVNHTGAVVTPLQFGTGDFTIEMWYYPTTLTGGGADALYDSRPTSTNGAYLSIFRGTGNDMSLFVNNGTRLVCSVLINSNSWNHIAVTRTSGTTRIFVNGNPGTTTWSDTTNYVNGSSRPIIGRNGHTAREYLNGYLSSYSIQKGVAKYTANFTPPTSPQLTGDYSQSLLLNAYPAIYDTTRKNAIETVGSYSGANGGPPYGARAERYSHYFNGTNDYLNIPYSPDFDFGTGDFTIETWVYIAGNSALNSSNARVATIIGGYNSSSTGWLLHIGGNSTVTGTALFLEAINSGVATEARATVSITQSVWNHIAITRNAGIVRFFLNGQIVGSAISFNSTANTGNSSLFIGRTNSASVTNYQYLLGYLHDLRVTKGFARYTANFKPANSPLPIK